MDDTQTDRLYTAMRRFFQVMKRPSYWQEVCDRAGITVDRPSALLLHHIATERPYAFRIQQLAKQFSIEAPSITRRTQTLERIGYLERTADERDGRAVKLQATVLGGMVDGRLWQAQQQQLAAMLDGWDERDLQQFIDLFERFTDHITTNSTSEIERKTHD